MDSKSISKAKDLDTDIVVVGAGGAGLAATLAAAEEGANVVLLEKQKTPGGNSALATGFTAAESPVQERMGIDVKKDDLFKIAMEYSHWEINPRIVRAWLNKSGDTVGWLEEKGVEFDMVSFFYPGQVHKVYHVPKGQGQGAIKTLVKNCEDQGIQILRQTRAKKILTSAAGNVIGEYMSGNLDPLNLMRDEPRNLPHDVPERPHEIKKAYVGKVQFLFPILQGSYRTRKHLPLGQLLLL